MHKTPHFIIAIDFSPSCRNALREAARRASLQAATLTAVHVMSEHLVHELKQAQMTDQATVRAEWLEKLKKFVAEAEAGADIHAEVRIGHPFTELVEACRAHEADLLVMGAKGSKDGPHRIGVITAKCVRKAPVDVLVVRDEARGPFLKIVACVDFSENSAKAVRHALRIAKEDGGQVDGLYVYQNALAMSLDYGSFAPAIPMVPDAGTVEHWRRELELFLTPLAQETGGSPPQAVVREHVNIREAILQHVEETQATLVVLGTRGKSGLRELLIGTTAETVVQHAPCSLLAVKPDGFVQSPD